MNYREKHVKYRENNVKFVIAQFPTWRSKKSINTSDPVIQFMQARYWLLTIPHADFLPFLPPTVEYIAGQLERGGATGYLHWQLVVSFSRKVRLGGVKSVFGQSCHAEPTRSNAARAYVHKDESAIRETR